MQNFFRVRKLVFPHLSLIRQLEEQGKSFKEICEYLKHEFSLYFSPYSLEKALALSRHPTNPIKRKKRHSSRVKQSRVKKQVKQQLQGKRERESRSEPNWKVIQSYGNIPVGNKPRETKRPELSDANAYLDLIRKFRYSGRSFQYISNHLKAVFAITLTPLELETVLLQAPIWKPKPAREQSPKSAAIKTSQRRAVSLVPHVAKIRKWKREGLNFQAIALRMKEEYGLDVLAVSVRETLNRENQKYTPPDTAALIYGAPEPEEEEPAYKPYTRFGYLPKKKV